MYSVISISLHTITGKAMIKWCIILISEFFLPFNWNSNNNTLAFNTSIMAFVFIFYKTLASSKLLFHFSFIFNLKSNKKVSRNHYSYSKFNILLDLIKSHCWVLFWKSNINLFVVIKSSQLVSTPQFHCLTDTYYQLEVGMWAPEDTMASVVTRFWHRTLGTRLWHPPDTGHCGHWVPTRPPQHWCPTHFLIRHNINN